MDLFANVPDWSGVAALAGVVWLSVTLGSFFALLDGDD